MLEAPSPIPFPLLNWLFYIYTDYIYIYIFDLNSKRKIDFVSVAVCTMSEVTGDHYGALHKISNKIYIFWMFFFLVSFLIKIVI